jgi:uncharacterized protein (DUF433 family)
MATMTDRIVIDPKTCHGKPVIRRTRTPVTVILDALAGGDTFEMIQSDYDITSDDIRPSYWEALSLYSLPRPSIFTSVSGRGA